VRETGELCRSRACVIDIPLSLAATSRHISRTPPTTPESPATQIACVTWRREGYR